jgi:hypothetical protein
MTTAICTENKKPMPLIYFQFLDDKKCFIHFSTGIDCQEVQLILNTRNLHEKCSHMDELCWVFTAENKNGQKLHEIFIRCLMMQWGFHGQDPQASAQTAFDTKSSFYLVRA